MLVAPGQNARPTLDRIRPAEVGLDQSRATAIPRRLRGAACGQAMADEGDVRTWRRVGRSGSI